MANALGIMMLDTRFERPPGDVGNQASWPFPAVYQKVDGATARMIVDGREELLLDAFVEAGFALQKQGATALITSCGFLVLRQQVLASRLPIPVATSSLLQIPTVMQMLPKNKTVGVVTYDAQSLTEEHFREAGVSVLPAVVGLPKGGAFHQLIEKELPYEAAKLEKELFAAVEVLLQRYPQTGAIVLECTNLPPFSERIRQRFGLPVFDVLTLGCWLYHSVSSAPWTTRN